MLLITAEQVHEICRYADLVNALEESHKQAPADLKDMLMTSVQPEPEPDNHMLIRAAWSHGNALGLKTAAVFPGNRTRSALPVIHAAYTLFDGQTGVPSATIDGTSLTYYKTAGDSALGANYWLGKALPVWR